MKCKVVGLTGSIGTGKSAVAKMFGRLGAVVIDADEAVHQLYLSDKKLCKSLAKQFGNSIIACDSSIDRAKLAKAAFRSKSATLALERITHPIIIAELKRMIRRARPTNNLCIVEAALLIESGFNRFCDAVVLVVAPFDKVKKRSNLAAAGLRKRNMRQLSPAEKLASANYLVDNSGTLAQTRRQINLVYKRLTK